MSEKKKRKTNPDLEAEQTVNRHTAGVAAAMVAIPIPGADFAATFLLWAKMIREIGAIYGFEVTRKDSSKLAGELLEGVVYTTLAWFGSAKLASTALKFIPGAGTLTAYLVDAVIAAYGAGTVTNTLGTAAATYYKSGKKAKMKDIRSVAAKVAKGHETMLQALKSVVGANRADSAKGAEKKRPGKRKQPK